MHNLPAAEEQSELDAITFFQKFSGVVNLYLDIVPVGFGSESYFLYDV